MVAVEKITNPSLIEHFSNNKDYYQQLVSDYEVKHGAFPANELAFWMANTLQPLVQKVADGDASKIFRLAKAFFSELLRLLGNGEIKRHSTKYKAAWGMLFQMPSIVTEKPQEVFKAISSSLHSLQTYQPDRLEEWIGLTERYLPHCKNFAEFLHLGRVTAWMSGMAHLRQSAVESLNALPKEMQLVLQDQFTANGSLKESLARPWAGFFSADRAAKGGFIGFEGGEFIRPPKVAFIDGLLWATDGSNCFCLFYDSCGFVMLPSQHLTADYIRSKVKAKNGNGHLKNAPDDINSLEDLGHTTVYTRTSSYKIFIEANGASSAN